MPQKVSSEREEWGGFHQIDQKMLTDKEHGMGQGGHSQCKD